MDAIKNDIIAEKLSSHINSFQEGFKILADSKTLEDIAEKFSHLLRGNLLTSDVNIFRKNRPEEHWKPLFISDEKSIDYIELLNSSENFRLNYDTESEYGINATIKCIDNSSFGLLVGKKIDNSVYEFTDAITFQIFINLLDNAYQAHIARIREKDLIFSLKHRVLQLNSLLDTGIEISRLQKNAQLLQLALERAVALTNASKGILRIFKERNVVATYVIPNNIDVSQALKTDDIIETGVEFKGFEYVVTLIDKESRDGKARFDDTDEILLNAFARQIYGAIENKELHKEALENEAIKNELRVAASIQKKILPDALPVIEGYDVAGNNIPSKEVGGDYYDCFQLNDGRFAFIIADVAGKGVPAALLVSTLNASLNSYLDLNTPPNYLAEKINKLICKASPPDKYITFFMAILEPVSGELDIINAGHNPSLLLRADGSLKKIDAGGVALGMFDMGLPFEGEKLEIKSGERLLFYTDGIPEAMTLKEEEYSDERMVSFFRKNTSLAASEFIDALVNDVKSFTGSAPQSDDITALYLIRN